MNKKIGAAAVIVDGEGRVLLVKQTYGHLNWDLPGGAAEAGESPDETVLQEVREETGLDVAVLHLTGYYHDAEADFLHFVFLCELRDRAAAPRPDLAEVSDVAAGLLEPCRAPSATSRFAESKMPSLGSSSGYRPALGRACGWSRNDDAPLPDGQVAGRCASRPPQRPRHRELIGHAFPAASLPITSQVIDRISGSRPACFPGRELT